ncbi:MAG: sigma-70 family RNA polymerase sigma factor [Planctomycetota bacterium]|jgi:RNA polymerase sigma-70 factor (ECF subfamily)
MDARTAPPPPEELLAHAGFLRNLARSMLADTHRAEDVTQETMLAALRSPPARPGNLRGWLARVARNLALKTRRSESRRLKREAAGAVRGDAPAAADVVARLETQRSVVAAVLALPEPLRSVVVERYFDELPPREIARRRGAPVETVRTWIQRAIAKLREALDREHGGDRRAWSALLLPLVAPTGKAAPVAATAALCGAAAVVLVSVGLAVRAAWVADGVLRSEPPRAPTARVADGDVLRDGFVRMPDGANGSAPTAVPLVHLPRVSVNGRVRVKEGSIPEGVWVRMKRLTAPGDSVSATFKAATKVDGTFVFEGVRVGQYEVVATHPMYAPVSARLRVVEKPPVLDLLLLKGRAVVVRVVDADGQPLGGQLVRMSSGRDKRSGVTDSVGTIVWEDLPSGTSVIVIEDERGAYRLSQTAWHVGDGVRTVTFRREADLSGRVLGPDGRPLVGAEVILSPEPWAKRFGHVRAKTDGDGSFEITGAERGEYRVLVKCRSPRPYDAPLSNVTLRPGERNALELTIPGVAITGRILRADTWEPIGPPTYLMAIRLEERDGKLCPVGWFLHAAPDAKGRYEFRGLPPGRYRVDVQNAPRFEKSGREVDIRATGDLHGVDFLLEPRGERR